MYLLLIAILGGLLLATLFKTLAAARSPAPAFDIAPPKGGQSGFAALVLIGSLFLAAVLLVNW